MHSSKSETIVKICGICVTSRCIQTKTHIKIFKIKSNFKIKFHFKKSPLECLISMFVDGPRQGEKKYQKASPLSSIREILITLLL